MEKIKENWSWWLRNDWNLSFVVFKRGFSLFKEYSKLSYYKKNWCFKNFLIDYRLKEICSSKNHHDLWRHHKKCQNTPKKNSFTSTSKFHWTQKYPSDLFFPFGFQSFSRLVISFNLILWFWRLLFHSSMKEITTEKLHKVLLSLQKCSIL